MLSTLIVALTWAAAPAPARSGDLLELIPPDSQFVFMWREDPAEDFMKPLWDRAWAEAQKAGIRKGFEDLVGSLFGQGAKAGIAAFCEQASSLRWGRIFANGLVAARVDVEEGLEIAVLLQPADPAEAFQGLRSLLKQAAVLAQWELAEEKNRVGLPQLGLELRRQGAYVVAGYGPILGRIISNLSAPAGRKGLWSNPRWKRAAAYLPAAQTSALFMDIEGLCRVVDSIAGKLGELITPPFREGGSAEVKAYWRAFDPSRTILCIAGVSWINGRVVHSAQVGLLAEGWRDTPLGKVFMSTPRTPPYEKVPSDATSFSYTCRVDLISLANSIVESLPDPQLRRKAREIIRGNLGTLNVSVEDLLWIFSMPELSFTLPGLKPTLFGTMDQSVVCIELDDPKRMQRILNAIESFLELEFGEGESLPFKIRPAKDMPGFKTLSFGELPMGEMGWGIKGRNFYFTSDIQTLKEVFEGKHEGLRPFSTKPALRELGMFPAEPVLSIRYYDTGRMLGQIAQLFALVGVGAAFVPPDTPYREQVLRVLAFFPRLAPFVRALDFFGDTVSVSKLDPQAGLITDHGTILIRTEKIPKKRAEKPQRAAF